MSRRARPTTPLRALFGLVGLVCALLAAASSARAQIAAMPAEMERVGVKEHLDGKLPLDTTFHDQDGKTVRLGDLFDGKRPVVLHFAYHTCPVVCGLITNNIAQSLKQIPWTLGKEFTAITISIDPHESTETMAKKRASILAEYGRSSTGWTFLAGDEASIAKVADAAGFSYQYDARQQQWAHPALAMVVKPDGRMARYLYGFEFPPADMRLALLEASEGRSISTVEQVILYCYHYDPQGGKYVLVAQRVMQVGGGVIAVILFSVLGLFWTRELVKHRNRKKDDAGPPKGGGGDDADAKASGAARAADVASMTNDEKAALAAS